MTCKELASTDSAGGSNSRPLGDDPGFGVSVLRGILVADDTVQLYRA